LFSDITEKSYSKSSEQYIVSLPWPFLLFSYADWAYHCMAFDENSVVTMTYLILLETSACSGYYVQYYISMFEKQQW